MIKFNELRVTPDGKSLIIDVKVEDSNATIYGIVIDNLDTYINGRPSSTPIYTYTPPISYTKVLTQDKKQSVFTEDSKQCFYENSKLVKSIRLKLRVRDFNKTINSIKDNIFFVYVISNVESSCGVDSFTKMQTATYLYPMYEDIMKCIRELEDSCNISKDLINSILRLECINTALKTGDYNLAIKYWKKFKNKCTKSRIKPCSCNG